MILHATAERFGGNFLILSGLAPSQKKMAPFLTGKAKHITFSNK